MLSVSSLFEERNETAKEKLKSLGRHTVGSAAFAGLVGAGSALYNKIKHGDIEGSDEGGINVPLTTAGTFGLNFALGAPGALSREKKQKTTLVKSKT